MRTFAQRYGPPRAAEMAMRTLLAVMLSAVGLAACGSSSNLAPASVAPSAPATSETPVASTPAATASSAPASSPTPDATSPTPVPSGNGASFDACALLTTAELAEILGDGGVQAKPMPSGGWVAGQCAWNGPASGFFLSVGTTASIAAFGDPAATDAKAKLAQFKSASDTRKDVAGIGDGAVVGSIGIAVYVDGTYLEITNLGLTEDQLVKIMKLAVAQVQ